MFEVNYDVWYILLNFIVTSMGVVSHFFKKKIKGETLSDIKDYFRTHFKNTVTTVIAAVIGFVSLLTTGGLGFIASFTVGYSADSLFNKAEGNATVKKEG